MSESFPVVSRQTLADRVYSQLRESIITGKLADGTELNQVELASQFGVSRVPVREALRRLQAEDLVVANPYQRHVVRAVSPEDILEMVELREELEVFALRKAMRRFAAGDIASVESVLSRQSVKLRGEQWLAADHEFHRQFHTSPVVASLIDDLRQRVHRYFQVVVADTRRRSQVIEEHRALLAAVRAGDEERAVALLRAHVGHTRELLATHLGAGDGDGAAPDTGGGAAPRAGRARAARGGTGTTRRAPAGGRGA